MPRIKRSNENEKISLKQGKLVYAVGAAITGMFLLIMVLCSVIMIRRLAGSVRKLFEGVLMNEAKFVNTMMDHFDDLPWLLDYWEEHPEEIIQGYDEALDDWNELYELYEKENIPDPDTITVEQAEALSPEVQKLIAVYSFFSDEGYFNNEKRTVFPVLTECYRIGEDGKFVFFMSGDQIEPYDISGCLKTYPADEETKAVWQSVQNGSAGSENYFYRRLGSGDDERFYIFMPVIRDGETVCMISSSVPWDTVFGVARNTIRKVLIPSVVLMLLGGVILMILLSRTVVRPVVLLQRSVQEYGETKNSEVIPERLAGIINRDTEFGHLAASFRDMAFDIDRYVEETAAAASEKERFLTELDMAKNIQKSQLPDKFPAFPDRDDMDLFALMDPAKEVGGDFYDFFMIDSDHIALVIGDVSDKGVPAALVMMVCRALIRSSLKNGMRPEDAMAHVNRQFAESNAMEMFVTIWIGVIELSTGKGIRINAGHEKPVMRENGGDFRLIRSVHDMAVGCWEDQEFTEDSFEMHEGDTLFVYTDGVPEAMNEADEQFGTDRMLKVLNKTKDASPEELIQNMKKSVDEFVGNAEQFDDITMLCFKMKK